MEIIFYLLSNNLVICSPKVMKYYELQRRVNSDTGTGILDLHIRQTTLISLLIFDYYTLSPLTVTHNRQFEIIKFKKPKASGQR